MAHSLQISAALCNDRSMNYRPIAEIATLELPSDVQAEQILIDADYIGRLAARRGLGQFYLTTANTGLAYRPLVAF